MKIILLSICLMTVLTGCGVEWFPGDSPSSSISITTTTLADATTGISYSQTLAATGGTIPYHWTLASGALPAGLTLSDGGIIAGIPTVPSPVPTTTPIYTFTVKVADSATTPISTTKSLTISTPISVADTTGKVFATILSFDVSRGMVVNITNTDSVAHTIQVVAANYDTSGAEIAASAFNLTPVAVLAGGATTITNSSFGTFTVNNWRIKSISFII